MTHQVTQSIHFTSQVSFPNLQHEQRSVLKLTSYLRSLGSPPETRGLLGPAGFSAIELDIIFIFFGDRVLTGLELTIKITLASNSYNERLPLSPER